MNISYKVPLIKQGVQECAQASAAQIISYYGLNKSLEEIKQEVPVYIDSDGRKYGTSLGHIATYFQKLGFKTKLHSSDIIIFDRSWQEINSEELAKKLSERTPFIKHGIYDEATIKVIVDGYSQYLASGGQISLPLVDTAYILKYLQQGPLYMVVSYNSLNNCPKYDFSGDPIQDDIKGIPTTHAIVISGYQDGQFEIVDPDFEFGGYRKISESQLLAAFYLAQTDMDSLFISFEK